MKGCKGCIHEDIKDKPWWSTQPHPCYNCERFLVLEDNYIPKEKGNYGKEFGR